MSFDVEELDVKPTDEISVPDNADVVPRHVRTLSAGSRLRSGAALAVLNPGGREQLFAGADGDREVLKKDVLGAIDIEHRAVGRPNPPQLCRPRALPAETEPAHARDRKSTRLNSSHVAISYAVFCL